MRIKRLQLLFNGVGADGEAPSAQLGYTADTAPQVLRQP